MSREDGWSAIASRPGLSDNEGLLDDGARVVQSKHKLFRRKVEFQLQCDRGSPRYLQNQKINQYVTKQRWRAALCRFNREASNLQISSGANSDCAARAFWRLRRDYQRCRGVTHKSVRGVTTSNEAQQTLLRSKAVGLWNLSCLRRYLEQYGGHCRVW